MVIIGLSGGLAALLGGVVGVRMVQGAQRKEPSAAAQPQTERMYEELGLFTDALAIVEAEYVEPPDSQKLIYGALKGMLASLDPYSQFMDPDTYKEIKVETEGEFGGLGIEITIKDDLLTVIAPIDGTPAYKAGVKAGDKILYGKYSGTEVKIEGQEYLIMHQDDILGIVE